MFPRTNDRVTAEDPDDENPLLWIAFFVGLLPVVVALVRGVEWGAEPTIGLLIAGLAGWALALRARDFVRESRRTSPSTPSPDRAHDETAPTQSTHDPRWLIAKTAPTPTRCSRA